MRLYRIPAVRAVAAPVAFLALCLFTLASPTYAASKHHKASPAARSHSPKQAIAHKAQAAHLARLAAQEKAAWRAHLAKLRELPHARRIAMKRHDWHFKKAEDQAHAMRLAQQKAHEMRLAKKLAHQARLARKTSHAAHPVQTASMRLHAHSIALALAHTQHAEAQARAYALALAAQHSHARATHLSAAQARHNARLAVIAAAHRAHLASVLAAHRTPRLSAAQHLHNLRLQAHEARLAKAQAAGLARLRAHQQAIAQRALAHQTRLARAQSAHAARAAAQRVRAVALHGDNSGGRSIHFWQTVAAGVPVKVITVDLNDQDVKVSAVMARRGNGTSEPFRQMIDRANPNVAVTGTFFSLDNLRPIGDIVIDGSLVHFGGMGTALCITPGNHADMVTTDWGRHHDWTGYDFVCACGPRLLRRGTVVLDPAAERFRDRHMLAPNSRIAVGITPGNKIVFAMTHEPIYLGRLAKVMRILGTSEAMNLDAGTSTGFYYNGATLARPGRQLTNMIVVYGQKRRYERALDQLVPAAYHHAQADSGQRRQVSARLAGR